MQPVSLECLEYLVDFELFFRDTRSLETSHLDRELLKSRLTNLAFAFLKIYDSSRRPNNPTNEEFQSLFKINKNKNVFIQKSVTGNYVVLIDTITYINVMTKFLDNSRQFKNSVLTRIKNKISFSIVNKKSFMFLRKNQN